MSPFDQFADFVSARLAETLDWAIQRSWRAPIGASRLLGGEDEGLLLVAADGQTSEQLLGTLLQLQQWQSRPNLPAEWQTFNVVFVFMQGSRAPARQGLLSARQNVLDEHIKIGFIDVPDRILNLRASTHLSRVLQDCAATWNLPSGGRDSSPAAAAAEAQGWRHFSAIVENTRPWGTGLLVVAAIALAVSRHFSGGDTPLQMLRFGAEYAPLIWHGEWWRLWAPLLVHFDAVQLVLNVVILAIFGYYLERWCGNLRFLALFVWCGVLGDAACLYLQTPLSAGMSPALYGVLAATAFYSLRYRLELPSPLVWRLTLGAIPALAYLLCCNLLLVSAPGHAWGLAGGLVFAMLLRAPALAAFDSDPFAPSRLATLLAGALAASLLVAQGWGCFNLLSARPLNSYPSAIYSDPDSCFALQRSSLLAEGSVDGHPALLGPGFVIVTECTPLPQPFDFLLLADNADAVSQLAREQAHQHEISPDAFTMMREGNQSWLALEGYDERHHLHRIGLTFVGMHRITLDMVAEPPQAEDLGRDLLHHLMMSFSAPGLAPTDVDPHVFEHIKNGDRLLEQGQVEAARAEFDTAVRLAPSYYQTYDKRGEAWLAAHKPEKALADFNQAMKLNPQDAVAFTWRGSIRQQNQDTKGAIEDFTDAIHFVPNNTRAYMLRGGIYADQGQFDKAVADYGKVLSLEPNNVDALLARAEANNRGGHHSPALTDLNRAVDLEPDKPRALSSRAWTFLQLGDDNNAIADSTQALALKPPPPLATITHDTRGMAYARLHRLPAARLDFNEAIRLQPQQAVPYLCRAQLSERSGDRKGASGDYQKALERAGAKDPVGQSARDALARLRQTH